MDALFINIGIHFGSATGRYNLESKTRHICIPVWKLFHKILIESSEIHNSNVFGHYYRLAEAGTLK